MATDIAVSGKTVVAPAQHETPDKNAGGRLVSLDAYRGLIMLLLVSHAFGIIEARTAILQSYPQLGWLTAQVDHSDWTGVTLWDLIQPAFTFMVGIAMPFAFARRISKGATFSQLFRHVAWRSFLLIVLSNVLSNFDSNRSHPQLQFINVLCQIAFGYMLCFLITRLRFSYQVISTFVMLAGYWALFVLVPGPQGAFSKVGNIGAVIDLKILGYNYSGYYTTINFIGNAATILFGYWAGMLLRSPRSHSSKLRILAVAAVAGFVLGLALEPFNPMVKRLWTVSFTFFSAGWVILMLMAFYWLIEMKQIKRWAFPMVVVGMNSIFIYSFSQVLRGWLNNGLKVFTGDFSFIGGFGAIPQNILVLCVIWYLCFWLYRRKIFLKI
jgi:heparan-alpha-glucosaminide N-acetyltransferase